MGSDRVTIARAVLGIVCVLALCTPAVAGERAETRTVKLAHGKAKIRFTPEEAETVATPIKHPRVGVAPAPGSVFSTFLARALDNTGHVVVVSPSRLPNAAQSLGGGADMLVRSEFAGAIASTCRAAHLDYLYVMGLPHTSTKTDVTAFVLFVGSTHIRTEYDVRTFDCHSRKSVWVSKVLFDLSFGTFASSFNGNLYRMINQDPDTQQALANVVGEKLASDMGW